MALWLTGAVLLTLTIVKPLGGIPVVGTIGFTLAAVLQLYLPLWRAGKLGRDYDFVGLHLKTWRRDLKIVLFLSAVTFPPFVIGHHLYMTQAHDWLVALGMGDLAAFVPRRVLSPSTPADLWGAAKVGWWFLGVAATHTLGVALPEETFYRGYLQPHLEARLPPALRVFGVNIGRAAVLTAFLFAVGHFLGEWNPLRLGPFFPALVFAWQRNATRSVAGAIAFHALCNTIGEVLFSLYKPL
jgi:membrane protease YdiL (CAAX protease family)